MSWFCKTLHLLVAVVLLTARCSITHADCTLLWFDGNDPLGIGVLPAEGTPIVDWIDKSGNGFDAGLETVSPIDTALPTQTLTGPGGNGMVRFNGVNQALQSDFDFGTEFSAGEDYTTFTVFRSSNPNGSQTATQGMIWADGPDGGPTHHLEINNGIARTRVYGGSNGLSDNVVTNGAVHISMSGGESGTGLYSIDGNMQAVVPGVGSANPTPTWLLLGMWVGGAMLDGDIGELIIFDHALSVQERADVNAYLGDKWGVSVPAGGDPARGLDIVQCIPEPSTFGLLSMAALLLLRQSTRVQNRIAFRGF